MSESFALSSTSDIESDITGVTVSPTLTNIDLTANNQVGTLIDPVSSFNQSSTHDVPLGSYHMTEQPGQRIYQYKHYH